MVQETVDIDIQVAVVVAVEKSKVTLILFYIIAQMLPYATTQMESQVSSGNSRIGMG